MAQSRVLDPLCAKIQIQPSLQHPSSRILGEDPKNSFHLLSKTHPKAPIKEVGAPIDDLALSRAFVCAQTAASKKFKMRDLAAFQRAICQREEVLTISGPHLNKGWCKMRVPKTRCHLARSSNGPGIDLYGSWVRALMKAGAVHPTRNDSNHSLSLSKLVLTSTDCLRAFTSLMRALTTRTSQF